MASMMILRGYGGGKGGWEDKGFMLCFCCIYASYIMGMGLYKGTIQVLIQLSIYFKQRDIIDIPRQQVFQLYIYEDLRPHNLWYYGLNGGSYGSSNWASGTDIVISVIKVFTSLRFLGQINREPYSNHN